MLLIAINLAAQRQNGYITSEFSGTVGATYQPASIADSPYKFDLNLVDIGYYITNNIANIQKTSTGSRGIVRFINNDEKFLTLNGQGSIGLMLSLPRKQAINIRYGMRAIGSNGLITPNLIASINRFASAEWTETIATNESIQFNFALWQELAFTYAKVLKDDGFHRLKTGITINGVNPTASLWIDLTTASYQIDNVGITNFSQFEIEAGFSESLSQFEYFDGTDPIGLPKGAGMKLAADFGIVYERVAYRAPPKSPSGTSLEPDITYEF